MSAKCNYSAKYKPLVLKKRSQLNEDAFRTWVYDNFANPDFAISVTNASSQFLSGLDLTQRTIGEAPKQIDSIKSYFVNNSSEYNKCIKDFSDKIVESSIYNLETNQWVDAEGIFDSKSNVSNLNKNLYDYKIELINRIFRSFKRAEIIGNVVDPEADSVLTENVQTALSLIDSASGNVAPIAYSAYVILKNFNKLINEKAKFVKVRKEYENTSEHGVNMYNYVGPTVKHRVSWTTNEHISAESQYSDLAKAMLNYLPEKSADSNEKIPNTSIGVDGFITVMNHFKAALVYSDALAKHRQSYYEGSLNMSEALSDYLDYIQRMSASSTNINQDYFTTQINKLKAIIDYIFNSQLDDDVKDMFKAMFSKTEPLTYMTYAWKNGKFSGINLKDSFVNTQMLNMQDTINGRVLQFRLNPSQYQSLVAKYGIKIDTKERLITFNSPDGDMRLSLNYSFSQGNYASFDVNLVSGSVNDETFSNFIADLLGVFLPIDSYTDISKMVNKGGSLFNDFKDLVAMTLLASDPKVGGSNFPALDISKNRINFRTMFLFNNFKSVGKTLSVIYGTETRNTVNDINGHALPTNGLTSLIFNSGKLAAEMTRQDSLYYLNPFDSNIVAPRYNPNLGVYGTPSFLAPIIRQGVRIGGKTKNVASLNLGELLEIAVTYDFLDNLNLDGETTDLIYLQNTNVADKERHLIIPYITKSIQLNGKEYDMGSLIHDVAKGTKSSDELIEVWRTLRANRYNAIEANICYDYSTVFGKVFNTLQEVDNELIARNLSIDQLRSLFRQAGVNFKEEIHASAINKIARVNEVLLNYIRTFNNSRLAKLRLQKSRAYFANDMFKSRLKLNKYTNQAIERSWKYIPKEWKETVGGQETGNLVLYKVFDQDGEQIPISASNPEAITNPKNTVVLNPFCEAYLLSDIIYSNEYNQLHVGDVFAHPTKNKNGETEFNAWGSTEQCDVSEASRLVAQNKRAVIYGGSVHSFQHDLANNRGVAKRIKISVIDDMKAAVWNMVGGLEDDEIDDYVDSMDGSGLQSIYEAILEQESLKDAAAGFDEKTILGWNDKYFGRQILLKWAVYALTNERRRKSRTSIASGEQLFRKMHSQRFNKTLNLQTIWRENVDKDLYFKDFNTRKYYKILGVIQDSVTGRYARTAIEVNENGQVVPNASEVILDNRNNIVNSITDSDNFTYNTLYDLDQFFGGADEMSLVDGKLTYTNRGNYIVTDIICKENLKDFFIAYAVNKSAVKVGVENLNPSEVFTDSNLELDTMEMSTEYGGLQMNAEHELEDSEVSEMTQMISALIEKGFTFDLVNRIYQDIGEVVLESMKDIKTAIENYDGDPEKLKVLFGKALIEAYAKGDRDTLGLAQSFLAKAERMLKENDVQFKFPFSGATINGSFIATVSSLLTKRGIRRKYSGIAAVLTPSYNMMQVYPNGKTLEAFADQLSDWQRQPENIVYRNVPIESLINDLEITLPGGQKVLNPFVIEDPLNEFDFEDTIVVEQLVFDEDGRPVIDENEVQITKLVPIIIDSYQKYDFYKNVYKGNRWIWNSRPRNLKGSNTTFRLEGSATSRSIYDTGATRAANYSIKKDWTEQESDVIFAVLKHAVNNYRDEFIWTDEKIDSPDQTVLTSLAENIISKNRDGVEKIINLRKTLYNIVQKQLSDISDKGVLNDVFLTNGVSRNVSNVNVQPAEIILGKMFAKQFGLIAGDDVTSILEEGSDFFYKRLFDRYSIPFNLNAEQYDAVAFTDTGEKLIVKIDENLDYNFEKSANQNITKVNGTAYLNEEELCSTEGKAFYQIDGQDGNTYNVIVVKDVDSYLDLISSKKISVHKLNYTIDNYDAVVEIALELSDDLSFTINDNGTQLSITYGEMMERGWDKERILQLLQISEGEQFEKRIKQKANSMAEAFKMSLNFVGARIPSQAMQSFQPMRVVAFTDSDTNDVYVNRHNTYLEGSDYDIDKSYILGYEVTSDGHIDTGTRLSKYIGIENSFELPLPKNRRFEEGENGFIITERMLRDLIYNKDLEAWKILLNSEITTLTFNGPILLEGNENPELLQIENEKRIAKYNKLKSRLLFMLNLHERSKVTEGALKNRVVHGILKVALNPKNQLNLHSPISMKTQKDTANRSELGKDEQNISVDIPSSKYMMQEQNMVGKQCIGITAVSIKVFFAKSAYYNQLLQTIPTLLNSGNDEQVLSLLESLVFENPTTGKLSLLANVNLRDIIENLPKTTLDITTKGKLAKWNINGTFDLLNCLKYLKRQSDRVDAAMELSGLLSASTDNAKELILSKINATSKFIDIYTVALQCGSTFDEIADILMSPLFNAVSRLCDNNIFRTYEGSYKLEKAIDFYLDQGLLPGIRKQQLKQVLKKYVGLKENEAFEDSLLFEKLKDSRFIESVLPNIYSFIQNANQIDYNEDGYDLSESSIEKPSRSDYLAIANLLEECLDRNKVKSKIAKANIGNYNKQLNNLRKIKEVFIPATEEQNILGRMLGINQGLRTSGYQQYSLIFSIESFINKRLNLDKNNGFSVIEFIKNKDYQNKFIQEYSKHKSFINILDVISKVPHFAEMFNSVYDNDFVLRKLSSRYEFTQKFANVLSGEYPLTEKEYKQVGYYINDLFIVSFLTSRGLSIEIPKDVIYYPETKAGRPVNATKSTQIKVDSLYGLASFKSWIENYVIPTLQGGKYRENAFIASLSRSNNDNRLTGEQQSFYKLPINMLTVDQNTSDKSIYETILRGFNDIANEKFGGLKIADIFFIYNSIVNKDSFGQTSMTRLFEDLVDSSNGSTLVSDYYEFISEIDSKVELRQQFEKAINVDDIRFYIKSNVPGTYISSPFVWNYGFDFTFRMPSMFGNWLANKPKVESYVDSVSSYSFDLSARDVLESLASSLALKYGEDKIQVHSQRWFDEHYQNDERARTNPAFIDNGVIYVNSDLARITDILHEYSHLVLASLKYNPNTNGIYYKLVGTVKEHPNYEILAKPYKELGLIGTDLDEEVFVKILQSYFDNRIATWSGNSILESEHSNILNAIAEVLDIDLAQSTDIIDVMSSSPKSVVRIFGSNLFNFNFDSDLSQQAIRWRAIVQSTRNDLINLGKVNVNCD